jgi:hypothetical protein
MSGTEIEIVEQEQRDEAIADAIVSGRSLRAVRKEFGLSQAEIAGALERIWPVDTASRLQMIKADLGQITRLTQVFFEKGLAGDTQSCLCAVRLWERKHELLGMNAAAKFEVVTRPPEAKSSHQRIADAINQMWERLPAAERAVRERLGQMSAERALELLGPPEPKNGGNGPDAVDVLSSPDDAKQNH